MTETEAVLRLVAQIDDLEKQPYVRVVMISEPRRFDLVYSLVLILIGFVMGGCCAQLWKSL